MAMRSDRFATNGRDLPSPLPCSHLQLMNRMELGAGLADIEGTLGIYVPRRPLVPFVVSADAFCSASQEAFGDPSVRGAVCVALGMGTEESRVWRTEVEKRRI